MSTYCFGNFFHLSIKANEHKPVVNIILPDGYSYETIIILKAENVLKFGAHTVQIGETNVNVGFAFNVNTPYTFPAVNSRSPCTIDIGFDNTRAANVVFECMILKFGQIPDTNYFNKTFDPILVTGDDGKEYNVIPSDQFK